MRIITKSTITLTIVLPALMLGCGEGKDPHGRLALTGTVVFEGQPLDGGSIKFLPKEEGGLSAGAMIREGKYKIPRDQGLTPGTYRVLISALAPTPKPTGAPGDDPVPPAPERIPGQYNVDSRLTVEVKGDQENQFDFTLK